MSKSSWLYQYLLRIRPAQFGAFLKQVLRIKRQIATDRAGRKFLVDPVSVFGLELIQSGVYEAHLTWLVEQILCAGDVMIDVGGNEGYFSVIAAKKTSGGRVICIEPQKRLQPIIIENARLNDVHSIELQQVALSDSEGVTKLYLRPSTNTGASSFFPHWRIGRYAEVVSLMTLDSLVEHLSLNSVKLLKCDCEGAEYLVIQGAKQVLKRRAIDYIVMEYHPSICGDKKCIETHDFLLKQGYVLTKIYNLNVYHRCELYDELRIFEGIHPNADWC